MTDQPLSNPTRMTADDRREQILELAIPLFAIYGLHGTSTRELATQAKISEAYIFRLFETKTALFIAAVEKVHHRMIAAYLASAQQHPENPLAAIGVHFPNSPATRNDLLLMLQAYAAAGDAHVQDVVRERFKEMLGMVRQLAGSDEQAKAFMGQALLAMVSMALDSHLSENDPHKGRDNR